jgi:hypothetical protein
MLSENLDNFLDVSFERRHLDQVTHGGGWGQNIQRWIPCRKADNVTDGVRRKDTVLGGGGIKIQLALYSSTIYALHADSMISFNVILHDYSHR